MAENEKVARGFNYFVLILIALMLVGLAGSVAMLIFSEVRDSLDTLYSVAYLILLFIDLPLAIFLYFNRKDKIYKRLLLGVSVTFSIYAISSLILYISTLDNGNYLLFILSQFIVFISYLPLIVVLYTVLKMPETGKPDHVIMPMIMIVSGTAVLVIAAFTLLQIWNFSPDGVATMIYAMYTLFDIIIMVLCAVLILGHLSTQYRYPLTIVFACLMISFIGDMLSVISSIGYPGLAVYAELSFSLVLIIGTLSLMALSMMGLKTTTIEEVDRKLSDTRLQMDDIIMQSPDAIAVFNVDGSLRIANDALFALFSVQRNKGMTEINLFRHSRMFAGDVGDQLKLLPEGKIISIEGMQVKLFSQPGVIRYMSVKIFPTYGSDGKISSYVTFINDVTVRKNAEDALKTANEALENRVAERTQQLEATNAVLQREIEARKSDEERIKASLNEKEVLLKEIHHRVKNNLQIVSSMLSLQSSVVDDPAIVAMNHDSQNRVRSMALIHEKLYQSHNLSRIDFSEYVSSLTNVIMSSYTRSNISVIVDITDIWLDIDMAIPCGLIINELYSNSLKHAFKNRDTGEVYISMSQKGDKYRLIIRDNGSGIPEGFDLATATTLGISLVHALVDQLEGSLEISRDNGTEFSIEIPVMAERNWRRDSF